MINRLENISYICRGGVGEYNEDSFGCTEKSLWVIDGATGLNGKNIISDESDAYWYSQWWNTYLSDNIERYFEQNRDASLEGFLYKGIAKVRDVYEDILSSRGIDTSNSKLDLPSASICLVRINKDSLNYIILGDCRLYIKQGQNYMKIADESVSNLDEEVFDKMRKFDDFCSVDLDEVRLRVMDKIIENRLKNNTYDGYWILSFDQEAAKNAIRGSIQIDKKTRVMVASDGYFSISDKYGLCEEKDLIDLTFDRGIEEMYQKIRAFESDKSKISNIPRFKDKDDSTCAIFEIEPKTYLDTNIKRVLHISAQKPDFTGSGIYMSGIIKGMDKLVSKQALIAGVDISDDLDLMINKFDGMDLEFYPIIYNQGQLNFDVPGMSDNMPYASTIYKNMTSDMADKMQDAIKNMLMEVVERFNPDLIVCHHLYFATAVVREIIKDIPLVAICHGTCLRQLMSHDFKKDYIIGKISGLDRIFALHDRQADQISSIFKICGDKIRVLGSGYDKNIFNCDLRNENEIASSGNKGVEYVQKMENDEIIISYAGKLSYAKGLVEFFDALENIKIPKNKLKIYIAGDGSNADEVARIREKGRASKYRVEFLGRLNQYQLANMFNESDIFVLPSYYEGLPLVLLEAMACGNSVLTTDIEGVREWLGDDINQSGIISYVSLPEMESVSKPRMDKIDEYIDRLSSAIEKSISTRLSGKYKLVDIESMSWDGLADKLYEQCEKLGR